MSRPLRALIADDHSVYRIGLADLLETQFQFDRVFHAGSLPEAEQHLQKAPDTTLAVFDLAMPGMDGLASLTRLRKAHPALCLAVASASEDREFILKTMAIGLNGYLVKSADGSEFAIAIRTMLDGRVYVPASILLQGAATPAPSRTADLTPRQTEVLACLRAGMTNREIAERLGISIGTVKTHVAALLHARGVRSRDELGS